MGGGWEMGDDDPKPRGPMAEREVEQDDEGTITEAVINAAVAQVLAGRGGRLREIEPEQREAVRRTLPPVVTVEAEPEPGGTPMPNADVIATIRRLAAGAPFVKVERLIEALS